MTDQAAAPWQDWAHQVPAVRHEEVLDAPDDPARTAVHLSTWLGGQYVIYERDEVWHFAAGAAVTLTADTASVTARAAGREWTVATDGRPLDQIAAALTALGHVHPGGRRVFGWAAFELAHLLHGERPSAGTQPLLHLLVPCLEAVLTPGKAELRAVDDTWTAKIAESLRSVPQADPLARTRPVDDVEAILGEDGDAYMKGVSDTIADIEAGRIDKAVLSRAIPLPAGIRPDLPASYLAGRRGNTPARSFLLDLGGWRAAGFSPETVAQIEPGGRVSTQPLAGTRALGLSPDHDRRLRAELLADSKEVHEHAISVRLACEELQAICRSGSVAVEEFMTVKERGSVQHLASRVAGHLRDGVGPWSAFGVLFPAITATGVPKAAALAALARHEPGTRGLYGGAVLTADTHGALDAALVLRTIFRHGDATWLRAGAGVMRQSTPEREYEETREKLRSVAPYLRLPT
ncbi:salicylate synthase [Actinoallomurus spadix]|uniref:Salicylate synthase n=1 Tax=Actinoallomurus spadix TaxID=79912 RepID=A0ABN0WEE6_9ACTN|nr:salicylate synthase [Actinoallomurus spadix]MCO5987230.1 salicylate synthase [Actinoallomurus spadix]